MSGVSAGRADSEVVPFAFGDATVRAGLDGGRPWFVLADLATALGYRDAADAGRRLRSDQGTTHVVCTADGNRRVRTVTESGMYRLVLRSNRPEAERFQDWVTDEVLPAIRTRGVYATPEVARELAAGVAAAHLAVDAVLASGTARAQRAYRAGDVSAADRDADLAETRALVDARQHLARLGQRFPVEGVVEVPATVAVLAQRTGKAVGSVVTVDPWQAG